jgi:single-stranded-DNA-specific exonuclease
MINLAPGRDFLTKYRERSVVIVPHPHVDGLAGAAMIWRGLQGPRQIICPEKGGSVYSEDFRSQLLQTAPDALIVIDQGAREGALAPRIPTMTVDHHTPSGIPEGVYITSYPALPGASAAHLCFQLNGEVEDELWLAALGEINDHGLHAPCSLVEVAKARYSQSALLETVSLISAASSSSRYDWQTAFDVLLNSADPRVIAGHELPAVEQLVADRDEISRDLQRARRAHPFLSDPWAVIPFSSPCLIHGAVASGAVHRLHAHFVLAANFAYQPGWVFFSIRSERPADLLAELQAITPPSMPHEWTIGHHGATGGALSRPDFRLLLNHMGFTPPQALEIVHAGMRN